MVGVFAYDLVISFIFVPWALWFSGQVFLPHSFGFGTYLPVFLTALGLSWFLSAFGVFIRDINQVAPFWACCFIQAEFFIQLEKQNKQPCDLAILQWNPSCKPLIT